MAWDEHARHGETEKHSASNPHPLHGKDPNIMNELGHTVYPKHVDHPTLKRMHNGKETAFPERVIVNDADEEAALLGTAKDDDEEGDTVKTVKPKNGQAGWGDK